MSAADNLTFADRIARITFDGDGMIYRGAAHAVARDADSMVANLRDEVARLRGMCGIAAAKLQSACDIIERDLGDDADEVEEEREFANDLASIANGGKA